MEGNDRTGEPRHAHETRDASIRNLIIFGVGLCLLIIAGLVVSRAVFHYFVSHQGLGPPASPFENVRTLPPEPRLQVAAPKDLEQYNTAQEAILNSYGWIDEKKGIVRIPIDRAMDILLQRGFPVRASNPSEQAAPKSSHRNPGREAGEARRERGAGVSRLEAARARIESRAATSN